MSNVECQRFFAFSKRVPKDVKRFCGICRQHGKLEETRGHICEFKDCECQKCNLVRSRRLVMSQQIRLRRAQDKRFQRTTEPEEADVVPILSNAIPSGPPDQQLNAQAIVDAAAAGDQHQLMDAKNMCYFCQKCKNHGILVWKKQHKRQCPFTNCTCDFCELIETRRRLDQHIKRRKSEPQSAENGGDDKSDESDESVPRKKSTASLPAQIEAMTMAGGSSSSAASSVSNAFWRASPPGGAGLSIPIGIAQNRIAEQPQEEGQQSQQPALETPLDALAAQISRIQQNSPEQHSRQSPASSPNFGIPMSATSSPPPALAPMVPSAPSLDQQQQILLNQLLLSSGAAASILPAAGLPMAADFSAFAGAAQMPQMFGGGMEQMLAAAAAASSPSQSPAQNDALLGQFLLHCMAGQPQMMAGTEMKPQAQIPLAGAMEGEQQHHRELLLQIIAQLLQDQHLSDQQQQQQQAAIQQQQQQQQKTLMDALMMANLGGIAANHPIGGIAEIQQLVALQSAAANGGIDPALLATSLLMTQHQQQQQQEMFKDATLLMPPTTTESEIGNNKRQSQSPPAEHHHHQSAFTALRPGTFGGLP